MTSSHDQGLRELIRQIVAEERRQAVADQDPLVLKTVGAVLTGFGIEEEDRLEIRADLIHLRKWRKSVEQVERLSWAAIITAIVGGALGAFWLGIKVAVLRQ